MGWERLEKTALITGASSGIGAATARRMAAAGARVILVARRFDRIQALADEIGNGAEAHAVDLRDRSDVEALVKRIELPDVVVNNAGIARGREPLDETTIDDLDDVFNTNVKGVFYLTHQMIGPMRQRNSGHIISVTSVAALYPYRGAGAYAPSKAAIHMFCKCLRNDLGGTRVRVSEIAPAMVQNTEFTSKRFDGDADRVAATYKGLDVLLAEDIAEAILFAAAAPARVNVDLMEIFPVQQHQGPNVMNRDSN